MDKTLVKKEECYRDFYQKLREKINRWLKEGKLETKSCKWSDHFVQYLLALPDFVHLLIKLLTDRDISTRIKGYIIIVMAYLISPIDIIPDFVPVAGFVDDLLVLVIFLNKIINTAEETVLEKIRLYWAGKEDIFEKVQEIIELMNELSSQIPKSIYRFIKNKGDQI